MVRLASVRFIIYYYLLFSTGRSQLMNIPYNTIWYTKLLSQSLLDSFHYVIEAVWYEAT
jgi:hypothetical protein